MSLSVGLRRCRHRQCDDPARTGYEVLSLLSGLHWDVPPGMQEGTPARFRPLPLAVPVMILPAGGREKILPSLRRDAVGCRPRFGRGFDPVCRLRCRPRSACQAPLAALRLTAAKTSSGTCVVPRSFFATASSSLCGHTAFADVDHATFNIDHLSGHHQPGPGGDSVHLGAFDRAVRALVIMVYADRDAALAAEYLGTDRCWPYRCFRFTRREQTPRGGWSRPTITFRRTVRLFIDLRPESHIIGFNWMANAARSGW